MTTSLRKMPTRPRLWSHAAGHPSRGLPLLQLLRLHCCTDAIGGAAAAAAAVSLLLLLLLGRCCRWPSCCCCCCCCVCCRCCWSCLPPRLRLLLCLVPRLLLSAGCCCCFLLAAAAVAAPLVLRHWCCATGAAAAVLSLLLLSGCGDADGQNVTVRCHTHGKSVHRHRRPAGPGRDCQSHRLAVGCPTDGCASTSTPGIPCLHLAAKGWVCCLARRSVVRCPSGAAKHQSWHGATTGSETRRIRAASVWHRPAASVNTITPVPGTHTDTVAAYYAPC